MLLLSHTDLSLLDIRKLAHQLPDVIVFPLHTYQEFSRMSQSRKFDRHASRGVFVRISLLEFGYKMRFITQKSVTYYFVYQNSRRETRTNTPRAALIQKQKWLRGIRFANLYVSR